MEWSTQSPPNKKTNRPEWKSALGGWDMLGPFTLMARVRCGSTSTRHPMASNLPPENRGKGDLSLTEMVGGNRQAETRNLSDKVGVSSAIYKASGIRGDSPQVLQLFLAEPLRAPFYSFGGRLMAAPWSFLKGPSLCQPTQPMNCPILQSNVRTLLLPLASFAVLVQSTMFSTRVVFHS